MDSVFQDRLYLFFYSVEKSVYELNDANMPIAYMNYKWNDYKWIEESAGNWAMNIQTPVTDEADLLLAGR